MVWLSVLIWRISALNKIQPCDVVFYSFCLQVGEGERLVKALFAVAAARQPSVIFVDEVLHLCALKLWL